MKRALNYIQKLAAAASRSVKYFMLAEPSPSWPKLKKKASRMKGVREDSAGD